MLDQLTLTLTIDGVAEHLHCSRATVYRLFKSGQLPSRKIGGLRRVLLEDLEAYLVKLENASSARA